MKYFQTALMISAAISLSACSSRPREFAPVLTAAPADSAKFSADFDACRRMVAQGQRSDFGARVASGGVGVAAGVGLGAAVAGGGGGTMVGAMAAASTMLVAAPIIGVAGAWGVAKRNKNKKEREIKAATALCLSELGYTVEGWKVARDQQPVMKPVTPIIAASNKPASPTARESEAQ